MSAQITQSETLNYERTIMIRHGMIVIKITGHNLMLIEATFLSFGIA